MPASWWPRSTRSAPTGRSTATCGSATRRPKPPDEDGQGDLFAGYAIAAHRAVVEVDPELGLVRVVQVDTAQDVGKVLNPKSLRGQVEGGILQGVGLAVMEELIIDGGIHPQRQLHRLPAADLPGRTGSVDMRFIEEPDHWGPFGAKGVGEPPTISSTPAVVAAIRAATGKDHQPGPGASPGHRPGVNRRGTP